MKLGVVQAILWTFGIRLTFLVSLPLAAALLPGLSTDLVMLSALLAVAYLGGCALFAARRPGRTWSETFAFRRTSLWLIVLALALGLATYLPAAALTGLIERSFPMSVAEQKAHEELMTPRSFVHAVALFVFAAGVGPFAEELLFRGALYTGLRPSHSPAYAGWTTGVLFTLGHEPRSWPAVLALSGLLAMSRAVSGSLWPPLFLHAAFNATALFMEFSGPRFDDPSVELVLGCLVVAVLLTVVLGWIGRASQSADRARQIDLQPDPAFGEPGA